MQALEVLDQGRRKTDRLLHLHCISQTCFTDQEFLNDLSKFSKWPVIYQPSSQFDLASLIHTLFLSSVTIRSHEVRANRVVFGRQWYVWVQYGLMFAVKWDVLDWKGMLASQYECFVTAFTRSFLTLPAYYECFTENVCGTMPSE